MAAIIGTMNLDDLIRRYIAGEPLYRLAIEAHTDYRTARKMLVSLNVKIRNNSEAQSKIDAAAVINAYNAGESTIEIANRTGFDSTSISRVIRKHGGKIRPTKIRAKMRINKMTADEINSQVEAMRKGRKSKPDTIFARIKRAQTVERKQLRVSRLELQFRSWIEEKGIIHKPQCAVGPYNIDIAVYPVAVEIFGGNWHAAPARYRKHMIRAKYLFDRNWAIYIIWHDPIRYPISRIVADDFISYFQTVCSLESPGGHYRVIRGDGEIVTFGCHDSDDIPLIKAPCRSYKSRT